ncbi:hypothetical protein [Alkalicoccus luteus]|uniref:hypothetical protein n=1 Tax=Alkalicoccus luteus TaxID=1237094 RepID=UPI004034E571
MLQALQGVLAVLALMCIVPAVLFGSQGFVYGAIALAFAAFIVQIVSRRKNNAEEKSSS